MNWSLYTCPIRLCQSTLEFLSFSRLQLFPKTRSYRIMLVRIIITTFAIYLVNVSSLADSNDIKVFNWWYLTTGGPLLIRCQTFEAQLSSPSQNYLCDSNTDCDSTPKPTGDFCNGSWFECTKVGVSLKAPPGKSATGFSICKRTEMVVPQHRVSRDAICGCSRGLCTAVQNESRFEKLGPKILL